MAWYREYYILGHTSHLSNFLLHLPYLNYLFWFFQGRGAYKAIQNYYYHNETLPSVTKTFVVAIRFAFYGTIVSSFFMLIALYLDLNYFGKAFSYFLYLADTYVRGYIPFTTPYAGFVFNELPVYLNSTSLELKTIQMNIAVLGSSYLVFALIGSYLSLFHAKADLKRSVGGDLSYVANSNVRSA